MQKIMVFLNCFWIFLILSSYWLNIILACRQNEYGLQWSSAGPINGKHCVQIIEIADPHTWNDNYLCFQQDYGVRWSSGGTIGNMRCTEIAEPADPHTWFDNYLCVPYSSPFIFRWSSGPNPIDGLCCIQMYEPADPHTWHDNYICVDNSPTTTTTTTTMRPTTTTTRPITTTTTRRPTTTTMRPITTTMRPTTTTKRFRQRCLIPDDLPDELTVRYEANKTIIISNGSYVADSTWVNYKCKPTYVLEGSPSSLCFRGEWTTEHPICRKYCSPQHISGVTIEASCNLAGRTISCQQAIPPGTVADINCANGYKKPNKQITHKLHCDDNGRWDYSAFRCEQICGIGEPEGGPYIFGGNFVNNITSVPWHVGIYSTTRKPYFDHTCGGTIINAKVVLSAAHCFWDVRRENFFEPSLFQIAAGKYFLNLTANEQNKVQISNITQIIHKNGYGDYLGNYESDIALLILAHPLEFNVYVRPICLEINLNFNEKLVQPGLVGRVAGWGVTTVGIKKSNELKYIDLPAVEYYECKRELLPQMQIFLTGDKFCAGNRTGENVCEGDSGGGLVFPKEMNGSKTYFLRGIVSTGGYGFEHCTNDKYTFFTNVQYHIDFVEHIAFQNRPA